MDCFVLIGGNIYYISDVNNLTIHNCCHGGNFSDTSWNYNIGTVNNLTVIHHGTEGAEPGMRINADNQTLQNLWNTNNQTHNNQRYITNNQTHNNPQYITNNQTQNNLQYNTYNQTQNNPRYSTYNQTQNNPQYNTYNQTQNNPRYSTYNQTQNNPQYNTYNQTQNNPRYSTYNQTQNNPQYNKYNQTENYPWYFTYNQTSYDTAARSINPASDVNLPATDKGTGHQGTEMAENDHPEQPGKGHGDVTPVDPSKANESEPTGLFGVNWGRFFTDFFSNRRYVRDDPRIIRS